MMMMVWVFAPCRLVGGCQYVYPKRWHLPTSLHDAKTNKNIIIILTAVKTSNLAYFAIALLNLISAAEILVLFFGVHYPVFAPI
jgi:hypothetical protein